jgi:hypothetical protein
MATQINLSQKLNLDPKQSDKTDNNNLPGKVGPKGSGLDPHLVDPSAAGGDHGLHGPHPNLPPAPDLKKRKQDSEPDHRDPTPEAPHQTPFTNYV